MRGNRVVLDDRHTVRQHKIFAIFVVFGLLVIGLAWYLQVRMALDRGALTEISSDINGLADGWSKGWEEPLPNFGAPVVEAEEVESSTAITDAVKKAMQEYEIKQEIGRQVNEAMK